MSLSLPMPEADPGRSARSASGGRPRRLVQAAAPRTAPVALGAAAYLVARPLLALLHELLVFLAAESLGRLGTSGVWAALNVLPLDPIYTGTMFLLLSNVRVIGVAVAAPLGAGLHATWPEVFAGPELVVEGAWASAVIQPGASVIARGLATLAAEVAYLALAIVLVRVGLRRGPRALAVFGALLQAHVAVNHLADEPISLRELEATGLTFGFSILFTGAPADRPRLSSVLAPLPDPVRDAVLILAAVFVTYALALALVFVPLLLARLVKAVGTRAWRRTGSPGRRVQGPVRTVPVRAGLAAFALSVAVSPLGSFAEAESNYLQPEPEPEVSAAIFPVEAMPVEPSPAAGPAEGAAASDPTPTASTATTGSTPEPRPTGVRPDPAVPPRSRVEVVGNDYTFSYLVNGRPQVIRGMGYNPVNDKLSAAERAERYDRDFAAMRRAGVNTLVGWTTHDFDELLLDRAHRQGLGVVVPYDLPWTLDYTDPVVREALMRDALEQVARYKDHPAVRMWGPGNEVLHKLVFPSWLHLKGDPVYEARAEAFARFYVELIDRIHEIDPHHPVTYRDAEDGYVLRLRDALLADGRARPWFVYGINIYTTRLAEVIAAWPTVGLDNALFVSEFAPGGAGPADRPRGYRELWQITRSQPRYVLGGAPYVWTTEGPEEADRIFGLVDRDGHPVDGSLATIGRLYRGEEAVELSKAAPPGPRACSEAVEGVARRTVADLQASPYTITFAARTPPIVIGQLDNLPPDPLRDEDFRFERSSDPERLAWQRQQGRGEEWWVTWNPPSRPGDQVSMLIRESAEQVELAYVYHGPVSPSATSWSC